MESGVTRRAPSAMVRARPVVGREGVSMDQIDETRVRAAIEERSTDDAASLAPVRFRTGNADVDRLLPAILTIVVWLLCRRMMEGSPSYGRGFVDGAFALIAARVAWVVKESFMAGSERDRDALRSGLLWGVVTVGVVVAAFGAFLLTR